jgi:hypothetical protein
MHTSSRLMSAAALAFLVACSHAANNSGEATSASATASATTSSSPTGATTPNQGEATETTAAPTVQETMAPGGGTTISNGKEQVTIGGAIDPAKLGIPVYPGMVQAGNGSYQMTTSNGSALATYSSADSFDKVYAFYKSQLPADAEQMKTPAMAVFKTPVGSDTAMIELLSKSGQPGTEILVTRTKPQSQ